MYCIYAITHQFLTYTVLMHSGIHLLGLIKCKTVAKDTECPLPQFCTSGMSGTYNASGNTSDTKHKA